MRRGALETPESRLSSGLEANQNTTKYPKVNRRSDLIQKEKGPETRPLWSVDLRDELEREFHSQLNVAALTRVGPWIEAQSTALCLHHRAIASTSGTTRRTGSQEAG